MYSNQTKANGEVYVYNGTYKVEDGVIKSYVLEAALTNKSAPAKIGYLTVPINIYKDKVVINFNLYDPQSAQSPAILAKRILQKALELARGYEILEVECISEKAQAVQILLNKSLGKPESITEFTRKGNNNRYTTLKYLNASENSSNFGNKKQTLWEKIKSKLT